MSERPLPTPPAGYVSLDEGRMRAMGLAALAAPLREALRAGGLYAYAAAHPAARAFAGRGIAYAVPLPGDAARVVVRHSRHGGFFAALTGDRFLGATRAPRELATALRLARAGVPTPEIVAYATYPARGVGRRADVVSREVPDSADLAATLVPDAPEASRRSVLDAIVRLLAALTLAGARHPDLNVKNILVQRAGGAPPLALVLDVDRVWFDRPGDQHVTERNVARLARSARRWRERGQRIALADTDLGWIAAAAHAAARVAPAAG